MTPVMIVIEHFQRLARLSRIPIVTIVTFFAEIVTRVMYSGSSESEDIKVKPNLLLRGC